MNSPVDPRQFTTGAAYIAPWELQRTQLVVPNTFFMPIYNHLRRYFSSGASGRKPPRLLAIQGPAGDGKTEMTTLVCSHLGCHVLFVAGAALAGKHEGDARNALLNVLDEGLRLAASDGRPAVLVVDDIDRSVAALLHNTGHTINSQLLIGALHDLGNDRQWAETGPHLRVPIFLTGNNFSCLPETVVRPGRMRFLSWRPSWSDKADMWLPQFGTLRWSDERRVRQLVRCYHDKGEPLAFFIDLLGLYFETEQQQEADCTDILAAASAFSDAQKRISLKIDLALLEELAKQLHGNKARSYLRVGGSDVST